MKNALLLTKNQTHFLNENRQDPITGDSFEMGDEIVFCASCKSAFLKDSWIYMDKKHCNQHKTLSNFPITQKLLLRKIIFPSNYIQAEIEARIPATFLDAVFSFFVGFVFSLIFQSYSDLEFVCFYIGFALFIFRDSLYINQSIGKRMINLYFIDSQTKEKPVWYKVFARNLIWWLLNGLIFMIFKNTNLVAILLFLLVAQIIYVFYILIKGKSFIDELLQIELVEKNEKEENL